MLRFLVLFGCGGFVVEVEKVFITWTILMLLLGGVLTEVQYRSIGDVVTHTHVGPTIKVQFLPGQKNTVTLLRLRVQFRPTVGPTVLL